MKILCSILVLSFALRAQCPPGFTCSPAPVVTTPVAVPGPLPVISTPITYAPNVLVSAGGGFSSPSGKFAYYSISKATGVQNTYLTAAQEYTISKGKVQSCTLAGVSKPIYQFGALMIGITGLGGGCDTNGNVRPAASAQAFLLVHKGAWGGVLTGMKNSDSGYKLTFAPTWGK